MKQVEIVQERSVVITQPCFLLCFFFLILSLFLHFVVLSNVSNFSPASLLSLCPLSVN